MGRRAREGVFVLLLLYIMLLLSLLLIMNSFSECLLEDALLMDCVNFAQTPQMNTPSWHCVHSYLYWSNEIEGICVEQIHVYLKHANCCLIRTISRDHPAFRSWVEIWLVKFAARTQVMSRLESSWVTFCCIQMFLLQLCSSGRV